MREAVLSWLALLVAICYLALTIYTAGYNAGVFGR